MRFGTVALVGRTNVGKSTLLNAALGTRLAIVSDRPQTTRDTLLGVGHRDDAQIAFLDTPGLHQPRNELGRRMNAAALQAARSADVAVFVTDSHRGPTGEVHPGDRELLTQIPSATPCVVVINKIDLLRDKSQLLPLIAAFARHRDDAEVVPACMLKPHDVERVLDVVTARLPEGPAGYPEDMLTDRPTSFFVREFVREQVLRCAEREVPHAVAVSLDALESSDRLLVAKATLHVEKPGQRKILVGQGGSRIRQIGMGARTRLESLLDTHVHLELFVRVTPRWKNLPRQLAELGYDPPEGESRTP